MKSAIHSSGYLLKRPLDLFISLIGLLFTAPLFVGIWGLIRIKLGSPVFFRQERPGLSGKPFTMYKFRTMTNTCDAHGNVLPDVKRLTPLGRFLRSSSIDELPELLNVLKGDMSLVGPRPLLMRYMPYYTERERLRHSVRPGITGWAQINGRNESCWNDRLERDVWYAENVSLWLDISILLQTLDRVFRRSGIVVDARSIMLNLDEERVGNHRVE